MNWVELFRKLVDSQAKTRLLSWMLSRPHAFSVSDLGRACELSKASVSNIVAQWEKTGLVLSREQGRNKLISINPKFYLLPELKRVFEKTMDFQKPLIKKLGSMATLKKKDVKAVVIFGSRVRKDFSHFSDLDVLVAIDDKENPITESIMEEAINASKETGIRFSPVLMDEKDIRTRWKEKDRFLRNILTEGKILKGRKWIEHLQTAP